MNITFLKGKEKMSMAILKKLRDHLDAVLQTKESVNIAIATGSTLEDFIQLLDKDTDIPFYKINLYIVDEYVGMKATDERSCTIDLIKGFKNSLKKFKSFNIFTCENYLNEISNYNYILGKVGLDICILGVGNNGHVAFCIPPIKDIGSNYYTLTKFRFREKQRQVKSGWFSTISEVPNSAVTLSLWGISKSSFIIVGAICDEKKKIIEKIIHLKLNPMYKKFPISFFLNHENLSIYIG